MSLHGFVLLGFDIFCGGWRGLFVFGTLEMPLNICRYISAEGAVPISESQALPFCFLHWYFQALNLTDCIFPQFFKFIDQIISFLLLE